jgi:hypothetical protein
MQAQSDELDRLILCTMSERVDRDLEGVKETLFRFLIRELSVETSWDEYIAELKREGLIELEEAYNRAYARRYQ